MSEREKVKRLIFAAGFLIFFFAVPIINVAAFLPGAPQPIINLDF